MEQTCVSERLFYENARILFYKAVYPTGISERADRYYAEAVEAFVASCKGDLFALALEDYKCDLNPRKKYRHRQWDAAFVCETSQEDDRFNVVLAITVDGREGLLRREFIDVWESGSPYILN